MSLNLTTARQMVAADLLRLRKSIELLEQRCA